MASTETKQETIESIEPIVFFEEEEDFNQLYEDSLQGIKEQDVVNAKVSEIGKDFVTIDFGYKSDCRIPLDEFQDFEGEIDVKAGDMVEVYVEALEDEDGVTQLSKRKAEKLRTWQKIGEIFEEGGLVRGMITARIKGGLSVDIGVKAFLPGSQVDLRPVRNLDKLLGESFDFKILKYNQKRGNIVLSRRALLEIDREEKRKKTLQILKEGAVITGHVKNITDYGVFVDLGGVDGLLHITDMTWGRIVHPSEMFGIGDEVEVLVVKYFPEDQKVSLGLKQLSNNPWEAVEKKYEIGTRVTGKIVSITDYGAFIELEPGVEGLIHISEMSWTKKVRHPSKIVQLGDEVEALVKDLDIERKRISLSMKEAEPNPWKLAMERYPIGSIVQGKVRNITDFGIFIGLDEGIDGLVHVSDISWNQRLSKPSDISRKGEDIEVKVLNIDISQERLSLGIKQLTEDPWKNLDERYPLNSEVTGTVVNLTDFGIFVEVSEGVEGLVHISEIDTEIPKEKLQQFYPVNAQIRARVIKVDLEERRLGLSIIEVTEPAPDSEPPATLDPEDETETIAEAKEEVVQADVVEATEEEEPTTETDSAAEAEVKAEEPKKQTKAKGKKSKKEEETSAEPEVADTVEEGEETS
ncbi:MAG: 30S ribosomal protein S1 [SAR324 cluster bacterium]|nr:30S ribosomal protein S1 [Deltaproteobacteria bacterium]MDP6091054.1 30S ribosomal protein S1 [SAR324 cluster bacterium]MDP6245822.1 30S ribosomal protein S1 [SAR324 cluster bacterium]MDP6330528.1 30S ribosomal protein S1 [SAR324 cluster bacterium]MDP6638156.1 30S ribosomal protein S1 [SAR324 cluster bacterium]